LGNYNQHALLKEVAGTARTALGSTNSDNTGQLGNKITKGVKQDDFKALKFFQKACDLNFSGESNHCHHLNHTPFGKT
jgi:TPR repeat protein